MLEISDSIAGTSWECLPFKYWVAWHGAAHIAGAMGLLSRNELSSKRIDCTHAGIWILIVQISYMNDEWNRLQSCHPGSGKCINAFRTMAMCKTSERQCNEVMHRKYWLPDSSGIHAAEHAVQRQSHALTSKHTIVLCMNAWCSCL